MLAVPSSTCIAVLALELQILVSLRFADCLTRAAQLGLRLRLDGYVL